MFVFSAEELQIFKKTARGILMRSGHLPAGLRLEMAEAESCIYNNKSVSALPFIWNGKMYYVIDQDVHQAVGKNLLESMPPISSRIH